METPQSGLQRPHNPSTSAESDGISMNTISSNTRDDLMASNRALLERNHDTADEAVTSAKRYKSKPFKQNTIKGWAWEILAWTTSFASTIVIFGILIATQNKALPEWNYRINLSTLLSVFAQISSTALLVPASGCISQLKWLWFIDRSRSLSDFDAFDEASRGPLSSLWLIWKTRARYVFSSIISFLRSNLTSL